jgi:hypothetical protein
MKKEYTKEGYFSGGGKPRWDDEFDFLLFRQDFNGCEAVYFNEAELEDVMGEIAEGEILIHMNYSVLFAKNKHMLQTANERVGEFCFATTWSEHKLGGSEGAQK